ncbi:hypothetical protein [Acrocarpospora catenulata]|uniref:hypothetical protein n=1 Tax=Acrocarpospora catenulata TaxID=2836182 RepID=UPI001BD9FFAC|nr:hypothetical protein [Acrocarpospora catenulata]
MDLDDATRTLYGLPPGEFVAARTALAKQAKTAGDPALAKEIGKLRRPTVVAWAVNQLVREDPPELAELLTLGEDLRQAWENHDAKALSALSSRRAALTSRVARLVADLAARNGQPLGALTEVEQTLDAAVVDPAAADLLRDATLTTALAYSGFTPAPVARTAPAAPRPRRTPDLAEARERRRRELTEAAAAAERTAVEAEAAHADWAAELASAARDRDRRAEEVTGLETELAELQIRLAGAREKLTAAAKRADTAARDESRSRRAAEAARTHADTAARQAASPGPSE